MDHKMLLMPLSKNWEVNGCEKKMKMCCLSVGPSMVKPFIFPSATDCDVKKKNCILSINQSHIYVSTVAKAWEFCFQCCSVKKNFIYSV